MGTDLIAYIASRTPQTFVMRAIELIEGAYFQAHQQSETFALPERVRVRGQLRHYRQNEALRTAGAESGLATVLLPGDPKGELFTIVAARDIWFGRTSVPFKDSRARRSKNRLEIAAPNYRLEPVDGNLFEPTPPTATEGLGCLIVTVNPARGDPQSVPAALMMGVPYTNLKGWHLFEPVVNLLGAYSPEVELKVPDLAWARLKSQLKSAE